MNHPGNFIFFGTPDFAARVLEGLLERGFVPRAVVTNPDRPVGRKQVLTPPPVKVMAQDWSSETGRAIEILQPEKLDAAFVEKIKSLAPEYFLVFAYGKILRKAVLDIPSHGTIGIHPSFLPKYRGPSPFETALLEGEAETGVTLYRLDEGIDSGPILAKSKPIAITADDTFRSLAFKLAETGAALAAESIPRVISGELASVPQEESQATFTKKFKTEDGFVEPADLAAAEAGDATKAAVLDRKIRALNPEPGVWTTRGGKRLKLLAARLESGKLMLAITQEEGQKPRPV